MSRLTPPVTADDHIRGDDGAPVTLVEFADFECPFCGETYLVLEEVRRRLGGDLRLVFRHFPIVQLHPHALEAAEAAEAAGAQEQLWPMHDMLFENQDALEPDDILGYAEALGLDVPRFARELAGHDHRERVERDHRSGLQSGVKGTPSFFIDGERHDAPWDADTLTVALQAAIRAKAA
jgi:formate-nitrite transporter family protein